MHVVVSGNGIVYHGPDETFFGVLPTLRTFYNSSRSRFECICEELLIITKDEAVCDRR